MKGAHRASLLLGTIALFLLAFLVLAGALPNTPAELPRDISLSPRENPFDSVVLEAKAAIVVDARQGKIIYAKNEEAQLPLASLTKLMTALVVAESLPPDSTVTIKREDLAPEGDTGLREGQRWKVGDLLAFSLLTSSNDGVEALARALPGSALTALNEKAQNLSLPQTFFSNSSGLDVGPSYSGGYGSAKDIAVLFSYLLRRHSAILEATRSREILFGPEGEGEGIVGKNTNKAISEIPGVIASKTGFTDLAGGNVAIAFDAGPLRPIIIVVLGSTLEGRFADALSLAQTALAALSAE